jgi:hypothetical protein
VFLEAKRQQGKEAERQRGREAERQRETKVTSSAIALKGRQTSE